MTLRLADRLLAVRQRHTVGRESEQDVFLQAIHADEFPFCVLHVYGPGGIGKTTLLRTFGALCAKAGIRSTYVDARDINPSPDVFLQVIGAAMQLEPSSDMFDALAAAHERHVLLIDTYELLLPLDDWLRDVFLPHAPDNMLIVLSSRQPPTTGWRADPGWHEIIRMVPLRNLNPDESRAYLTQRQLPPEQHDAIVDWTHGHPLALSLVADTFAQRHDTQFKPETAPNVIQGLLERFVQKTPGPAHRTALEACALVRRMTESLLAEMLDMTDVNDMFTWLRSLSFIESGQRGLFPHDLAREALTADLRWRHPARYAELHRRARQYYARTLQEQHGHEQQRIMFDFVFLHRESSFVRPFLEWQESGSITADRMADGDKTALLAIIEQHEGPTAARLAAHWMARQPHNVTVYRDTSQQPIGLWLRVELQEASDADRQTDPATAAAWSYLRRRAPLRSGERAAMFRFWMARDTYQDVSAVQSVISINIGMYYMNTPGLAYTFMPCASPEFWKPAFSYMDLEQLEEAAFEIDGRRYTVFGHDWRVTPPLAWLDLLAERELAEAPLEHQPARLAPLVVLSQPEFEESVRNALRDILRPDVLQRSPLLRSRIVLDRVGAHASDSQRAAALQAALREAAETMQAQPREQKWYRAVYHTYLQPAATQEQAAELLDVPFSSYRRHLKAGVDRIVELLWQRELQGGEVSTK